MDAWFGHVSAVNNPILNKMYDISIAGISFSDFCKISSTCVISLEIYTWHYQPKFSSEIKKL